ncbi:MAG: hypothetical protein AB7I04_06085 [Pseudomonadales bacterium]
MEPHQQALVDQAIKSALARYDDRHALLRSSDDPRFRVVQESLAFAALLIARASAAGGRNTELGLGRLLIDTLLPLQNTTRRDPDRGAFPLLWTPDARRAQVMDPDSREIIGSLLGVLVRDHAALLGDRRAQRVREAVKLCIREAAPSTTSNAMIAAWLELEFGDRWRGERLATEVVLAGRDTLRQRRFGDPRAFARELWALGLWRRSEKLHGSVAELASAVFEDIEAFAHPDLPELLGAVTTGAGAAKGVFPWLGTWQTWLALGGEPMLPKQMPDPLHATLYAFPALARFKLEKDVEPEREDGRSAAERAVCHELPSGAITGWWEPDLHIEARTSEGQNDTRAPVAGARWRTASGSSVWLRCRVSGRQKAVCRKRFVHLDAPGSTVVSVHNMGPGETRMIDNGWWLSGLHFAMEGYQMVDAERSAHGLTLHLKPTSDQPMLMFSPLR